MGKGFIKYLEYIYECLLSVIYYNEDKCIICKADLEDGDICDQCKTKIMFCKKPMIISRNNISVHCYSASYYSNIMSEMIIRLKYKSDFRCGEVIGNLMIDTIKDKKISFDAIAFVPVTSYILKKRGYNQSEILGKVISKKLNIPIVNCLTKIKETKDQIGLDGCMRWENLSRCFKVEKPDLIYNKNILLIDDVITTGATAFYCSKEMINCGAKNVSILTGAKSSI